MTLRCLASRAALCVTLALTPRIAAAWVFAVCAQPDAAPYSARDGAGFDNRIAIEIAEGLGAEPRMVWLPDRRSDTARRYLHAGACDALFGVVDGQSGFMTSHAYYRTGFVFVTRAEDSTDIASLDDPALADLVVGLPGGARRPTPPSLALARRGRGDNLRHFGGMGGMAGGEAAMFAALDAGEIDVAVLWGPTAGDRIARGAALSMTPVRPEIDIPYLPMVAAFAIGVRPQDEALRDAINRALVDRWDAVQTILDTAGVPMRSLPRPVATEDLP